MGLNVFVCAQMTWQSVGRWIKAPKSALVDLVEFGSSDRDQTHVTNSEPSIALLKSNTYALISQLANDKTTRD